MTGDKLKKEIKKMPVKPGIYIFKSTKNKPLYIGKALNLKNRLNHYLKTSDARLRQMILESEKIDHIETGSDIEALILESQYIKKYRPDFNIMLRDDKQYFYIAIKNDKFPRLYITHQPLKNVDTEFIGPFTDGNALKTALRLLRKIFPYCTCKQPHNNYCLNYHIGKCPGFCCLKDNSERSQRSSEFPGYRKNILAIRDILSGKKDSLINEFEKQMKKISEKHEYEKAMELKYKIEKLKRVFLNAQIIHNKYSPLNRTSNKTNLGALKKLAHIIGIRGIPRRIESYDIANIQGRHATGAMVVFTDGNPDKNEYRKFNIIFEEGGDTGMLQEVLMRRFRHPEWQSPDLMVIDGGKAQFNAAKFTAKNIPVIAVTKNEKHIGEKILIENKKEPILLSGVPPEVRNLILRIDSEAHRFAISHYRRRHTKYLRQ